MLVQVIEVVFRSHVHVRWRPPRYEIDGLSVNHLALPRFLLNLSLRFQCRMGYSFTFQFLYAWQLFSAQLSIQDNVILLY